MKQGNASIPRRESPRSYFLLLSLLSARPASYIPWKLTALSNTSSSVWLHSEDSIRCKRRAVPRHATRANEHTALHLKSIHQIWEKRQPIPGESLAPLCSYLHLTQQQWKGDLFLCHFGDTNRWESSDLIPTWSNGLHLCIHKGSCLKTASAISCYNHHIYVARLVLLKSNILLWAPHAQSTWVYAWWAQVPDAGPADSGGMHSSNGPAPFKAQEEGPAPLAFVQVVWRRERSPSNAVQARNWKLLEEMWPSQLVHCWRELGWLGCLVKLIVTALTEKWVFWSTIQLLFSHPVLLWSSLRSLGKAAGEFAGHVGSMGG